MRSETSSTGCIRGLGLVFVLHESSTLSVFPLALLAVAVALGAAGGEYR